MVHIVARVVADGNIRTLSFKQNEVVFGGGRLTVTRNEIPLELDDFMAIFDEASKNAASSKAGRPTPTPSEKAQTSRRVGKAKEDAPIEETPTTSAQDMSQNNDGDEVKQTPPPAEVQDEGDVMDEAPEKEPKMAENPPTTRTRKRRTE